MATYADHVLIRVSALKKIVPRERVAAALGLWQCQAGVEVKFDSRVEAGGAMLPVIVVQFWRRGA
jgi:hypothetical protein